MKRKNIFLILWLLLLLALTGCSGATIDKLYSLPKRTDAYHDLQVVIDGAMGGLAYSAPLSGENQQVVQMVDLDGDGQQEYLLYAKGGSELSLKILIFQKTPEGFIHADTIAHNGTGFAQVEYVQMDNIAGTEIVVGYQLSEQLPRTVSVYTFARGKAEQLVSANYTKFLTSDVDGDGRTELFLIRPGQTGADNGVAELYGMENGVMERSNESTISAPVDKLKRIIVGKLQDADTGVYVASAVDESSLVTDVFTCLDGKLTNVVQANDSGTNVQTLRNYYVYADDIDDDGIVELPALITMLPVNDSPTTDRHDLIRWYTMSSAGKQTSKRYTYHSFVEGWYMELDSAWATRLSVQRSGSSYEFYIWDKAGVEAEKIFTLYSQATQSRDDQSRSEGQFALLKTDVMQYTALLEEAAAKYGITQENLIRNFHLIQQDWKTGEI